MSQTTASASSADDGCLMWSAHAGDMWAPVPRPRHCLVSPHLIRHQDPPSGSITDQKSKLRSIRDREWSGWCHQTALIHIIKVIWRHSASVDSGQCIVSPAHSACLTAIWSRKSEDSSHLALSIKMQHSLEIDTFVWEPSLTGGDLWSFYPVPSH